MPSGRILGIGSARRCAAALLGALALVACAERPPQRIVLVVIDTLRRDALGCYGGATATPRLDALAQSGAAVPGMSSAYHQTSASMAALFTGRTPSLETGDAAHPLGWTLETWCGMARFSEPGGACIPETLPTLAERMRDAGYWTIGVFSNSLMHDPSGFGRGFDDLIEVGARSDPHTRSRETRAWRRVHEAATAAIDRRLHDHFFLYVHYMDVHDHPEGVDYSVGVRAADTAVGELLAHLELRGLREGTVVVVTSDHGEHLGERHPPTPQRARFHHFGNPSYEELLAVPLLVSPASALGARPPRSTVELHDWLLRLAGAVPITPEPDAPAPDELYLSELTFRTYRNEGWKSAFDRRHEGVVLFDLSSDPHEQNDLSAARPDIVATHRRRVDELTRELAAHGKRRRVLNPEERARLEVLGYLQEGAEESP